ncbi:NAD(P)-dependent oxidoreductase [Alcaligenaceae bacterium]|nr:NAD(P)-dependent oxidoreductase [Alcaligenaceae bacterium]
MKFALIGGGVVGSCYAKGLVEGGLILCGVWDIEPSEPLQAFTAANGVKIHGAPGAWLGDADYVLSAVFGSASFDVARQALPFMKEGAVYVDMTTATPEAMAQASELAGDSGLHFVDVAITGAVNMRGVKTPLLCAGERADMVANLFSGIGAPVKIVDGPPGNAARLKLLRSIFSKGLEALTIECLATAEVSGLRAQLHEVLLDIDQTPLQALMETLVTTHIEHAGRRRDEVMEARQLMRANGIEPLVLAAVQALFERSADALKRGGAPGGHPDAALEWLVRSASARGEARVD